MHKKNWIDKIIKKLNNLTRENIIFIIFIFWVIIIISKTFSYTVLNHDFYKSLADKQQIWEVEIPVTRGNLYSSNGTIFATSINKNDLAIDPTIDWDLWKLTVYLRDLVFKELCESNSKKKCYEGVLKFVKKLEIEDFTMDEEYIKWLIFERLKKKLSEKKVTSVLIYEKLSDYAVKNIQDLFIQGIYITDNNLYVNPEEIIDIKNVALTLSKYIDIPILRLEYLLRKREKKYIPIIKKLSIDWFEELKWYMDDEKDAIKKWFLSKQEAISNFIILDPYPQRYYPEKSIWSQIIWFIDSLWVWHYWIEWYFNDILKWNDWYIISRKDINWRIIDPISLKLWDSMWEWARIHTTIDRNVQKKVEELLEKWVKKFLANRWTVVVMNPKTWEIISMANYPSYDPNFPWDVYEMEKVTWGKYPNPIEDLKWIDVYTIDNKLWKEYFYDWKKLLLRKVTLDELGNTSVIKFKYKNDFWPWVYQNSAISALYEPGSIMKAFTVAIWIDSWEINYYDTYKDNKNKVTIGNYEIKNVSSKCMWDNVTFAHALNYSCNVWMLRIAQKYWPAISYEYLNNFGFSEKTGINLEWEVTSVIRDFRDWSRAELFTKSYWLWISVTALQMATAYSVLVNGGLYIKPHIIDYIKFPNGKKVEFKKEIERRVIKEQTSKIIIDLLHDSIVWWVAKRWNVEWYNIWWKTWTSQIAKNWWYEKWVASTYWSYAWFWPIEDPKFVIIVKLERPRMWWWYWGTTSSYIFKDIAKYLLNYYEIPKNWA